MPEQPMPDIGTVLQEDTEVIAVPVTHDGPITTHELPSRGGPVLDFELTTVNQLIIGADLKRKRVTLVCASAWRVSHSMNSAGAPWPANVPLVLHHAGPIYASVAANTAVLTVIPEEWAD